MDSKACTKCGAVKPLSEFNKKDYGRRFCSHCKKCALEYQKKRRKENPLIERERQKRKRDKNPLSHRESVKKSRLKNHEYYKKRNIEYYKKNPEKRAINLLIQQGFTRDQITPELIELKREQIEMVRLSRQLKQAVKENNAVSN